MSVNDNQVATTDRDDIVHGVMPGGGTVPLRLPAGALNYLDRNQYSSSMEVVAFYPSIKVDFFGDEHSCMWTSGTKRMLAYAGGWIDITEPKAATVIEEDGLAPFQSCIYNERLKKWI